MVLVCACLKSSVFLGEKRCFWDGKALFSLGEEGGYKKEENVGCVLFSFVAFLSVSWI